MPDDSDFSLGDLHDALASIEGHLDEKRARAKALRRQQIRSGDIPAEDLLWLLEERARRARSLMEASGPDFVVAKTVEAAAEALADVARRFGADRELPDLNFDVDRPSGGE